LRDQLLAQRLRQRHLQDIDITPSEVRQWFERIPTDSLPTIPKTVRVSHIVRYPKPAREAREQARNIITTIRDSIVNTSSTFESMAREFSDDAGTASEGGELGDVNLENLVPEFAAVASRTPVGQVSQVFYNESQNGFHILRVNSKSGDVVNLNHILIRVSGSDTERAKSYLRTLRDSLLNHGARFEVLARRHSEEDRSASNGGRVTDPESGSRDLALERLNPSWRRVLQRLEEGQISEPAKVELLNGDEAFHIVRLDRRTPAHRANLEQDYERIRRLALQEKKSRKMEEWLRQLRDEVYVDVRITEPDMTAAMRGLP